MLGYFGVLQLLILYTRYDTFHMFLLLLEITTGKGGLFVDFYVLKVHAQTWLLSVSSLSTQIGRSARTGSRT